MSKEESIDSMLSNKEKRKSEVDKIVSKLERCKTTTEEMHSDNSRLADERAKSMLNIDAAFRCVRDELEKAMNDEYVMGFFMGHYSELSEELDRITKRSL